MSGEKVSSSEQAQKESHNCIRNLLGSRSINVDEPKAKIGRQSRVNLTIGRAKAENELPWLETSLSSTRKECKGVEDYRAGGLDPPFSETVEADVLDGGDTGQGLLFQCTVFDAIERHHKWKQWRLTVMVGGR